MRKHEEEKHNGECVEFKVRIFGSCPGDVVLWQCMEAVVIRDVNLSMNGGAEWGIGKGKRKKREATSGDKNNHRSSDNNSENGASSNNISSSEADDRSHKLGSTNSENGASCNNTSSGEAEDRSHKLGSNSLQDIDANTDNAPHTATTKNKERQGQHRTRTNEQQR